MFQPETTYQWHNSTPPSSSPYKGEETCRTAFQQNPGEPTPSENLEALRICPIVLDRKPVPRSSESLPSSPFRGRSRSASDKPSREDLISFSKRSAYFCSWHHEVQTFEPKFGSWLPYNPSTRPVHRLLRANGLSPIGRMPQKPFVLSPSKHGRFFVTSTAVFRLKCQATE